MTAFAKTVDGKFAAFIHIPKNGGSSVGEWIKANARDGERISKNRKYQLGQHETKRQIFLQCKRHRGIEPDIYFTVIRNPYARVVSAFHFYKRQQKIPKTMNFEEFVKSNEWFRANRPQMSYLDETVKIRIKLENIADEFSIIQDMFGSKKNLSKVNSTAHKHYSFYYSPMLRDIVYERHQRDFEELGYEFYNKFE